MRDHNYLRLRVSPSVIVIKAFVKKVPVYSVNFKR